LSLRRASTSLLGIATMRPPQRHRRLAVSARSNAVRRHVPQTAISPIFMPGSLGLMLPPSAPGHCAGVHDGAVASGPDHLEDVSMDKKAKTPKKPKTAKPKSPSKTA
jgi:hypothetical protein